MSEKAVSDAESTSPIAYSTRPTALWLARLGWMMAAGLTVVGLLLGKGMSLSSVSLFSAAMTVWTYRDTPDRDISWAAWADYLTNIAIAVAYALVVLGFDNDGAGVWIDATAALFLVVFVIRRARGDRDRLEQGRSLSVAPLSGSKSGDGSSTTVAATVTGGLVLAVALGVRRHRRRRIPSE